MKAQDLKKQTQCLICYKKKKDDDCHVIDKTYSYLNNSSKAKHQYLIQKHEQIGLEKQKDPKGFIEYAINMQDVYKNIGEYNPGRKREVLIVFEDTIATMISNKNLKQTVNELLFHYAILFLSFTRC